VWYDSHVEKRKKYDASTVTGMAANDLLCAWHNRLGAKINAPWRQTTEGQEFGDHHWVLTLQAAFDVPDSECPEFHLWQLAAADYTVRCACGNHSPSTDPPDGALQAHSLMEPSNAKAIYWDGCDLNARRGNNMGDTEKGTREWMDALTKALDSSDPPPVSYTASGSQGVITKSIVIIDFNNDDGMALAETAVLP
jgi:hypothetical protein